MTKEMKRQYFWKKASLKYEEVKAKLEKLNTFKECLKLVNDFTEQDYLINSYIEALTTYRINKLNIMGI